jgi:hypothetical protein
VDHFWRAHPGSILASVEANRALIGVSSVFLHDWVHVNLPSRTRGAYFRNLKIQHEKYRAQLSSEHLVVVASHDQAFASEQLEYRVSLESYRALAPMSTQFALTFSMNLLGNNVQRTRRTSQPRISSWGLAVALVLTLLFSVLGCDGDLSPGSTSHRALRVASVLGTSRKDAARLVRVRVGDDTLIVTREHPFFVPGRGWTPAAHLKRGDVLDGALDGKSPVQAVEPFSTSRVPVFNLLVAKTHSYRVGHSGVLVHNADCADGTRQESESSSNQNSRHPSERDLEQYGITPEEKDAIRKWTRRSYNFRALSVALAEHSELATMSYAEAGARGWLRTIELGTLSPQTEFEQLRHELLVDIPSFIEKMPKYRGTVYRGMRAVSPRQIDIWRERLRDGQPIELGYNGRSGYAGATDQIIIARRYARRFPPPNRVNVVLVIEQHSAVSVRAASRHRSEDEVLIPEGTRFRITSIEESSPGSFTVHLVEI